MEELGIDIETRSGADLTKTGVYKYIEDSRFTVLLFAYHFGDGPVKCVDLAHGEVIPAEVMRALTDKNIRKTAHNVQFEFNCLQKFLGIELDISQWDCTLIRSASLSLPMALHAVGSALRLPEQKDFAGKALIKLFCIPDKKTDEFNSPDAFPEQWNRFKSYCIKDVIVEHLVRSRVLKLENITPVERAMYALDQKINSAGFAVDLDLIYNAIELDTDYRDKRIAEAIALTGLTKPTSVKQLREWLSEEMDEDIPKLRKNDIPPLLKRSPSDIVTRVLQIRQELSKTSVTKFKKMLQCVCRDGRIRGLLQMYGAQRTGRFAGRLVQAHNLPKNDVKPLDMARQLAVNADGEMIELLFGPTPAILSQLIRTAFVAAPGHRLIVSDFSAIEARVIAWLADEKWRLNVFRTHGKIYEASASQMFHVPLESIGKDSPERARGKVAELALGFGGSVNALIKMDTEGKLKREELQPLVDAWRAANPAIVRLWRIVNDAALHVVETGESVTLMKGIKMFMERGVFFIHLPSGRKLTYLKPRLVINRFDSISVAYEGQNQTSGKWELQETYGGKLVENIVQAIARDLLVTAMLRTDARGYKIVLHVHDEIVTEMLHGTGSVEELNSILSMPVEWAEGLPLKAAGFESVYYKKD